MLKQLVAAVALAAGCCSFMTTDNFAAANQCGKASWYSLPGQTTASGQKMNPNAMTAAHKTLKMGSIVKVIDQTTGKSIQVTINDRGPYIKGRIIDLSKAAADQLGIIPAGTAKVCITTV